MKFVFVLMMMMSCSSQVLTKYHTGPVTKAKLLEDKKWKKNYDKYKLTATEKLDDAIDVVVVFGLWCHDSKREIPRLLKTLDAYQLPESKLKLIAVNRKKTNPLEAVKQYKVHFTPTIVVNFNGKEIERFVEYPHSDWRDDFRKIAKKYKAKPL